MSEVSSTRIGRSGRLSFAHADEYRLILSAPIVREILEVLQRPEISGKIRFVAGMDTRRVLDILSQAELVEVAEISPISRDPEDDKFLATAVFRRSRLCRLRPRPVRSSGATGD